MPVVYVDSSAIAKLIHREPGSSELATCPATVTGAGADVFVTYDERQAAAARLAGFRTLAPGV